VGFNLVFLAPKQIPLFIYCTAIVTMYLLIYIDDIIIVSSVPTAIDDLLQLLSINFAVKDSGTLFFLSKNKFIKKA